MSMAAPPPVPGESVDPPPREARQVLARIEDRTWLGAIAYRAVIRFNGAHALLLAAGTTYYVFLAVFSLMALAFGLVAVVGTTQVSQFLSSALGEALPGLVGDGGVDADQLRAIGQSTSLLGLAVFLYSGAAMMTATSNSLHMLFGAPKDPRNFVVLKLRLLAWLALLAPLLMLSFTPSLLVTEFADPLLSLVGVTQEGWLQAVLLVGAYVVSLALNFLVVYLLLGHLSGIKPARRPRIIGAAVAAVSTESMRAVMASIVAWAVERPQYGAFAVPIAVMLVLFLQTIVLYFCAALTAALAEHFGGQAPAEMTVDGSENGPFAAVDDDESAEPIPAAVDAGIVPTQREGQSQPQSADR
jgi:membrane protein